MSAIPTCTCGHPLGDHNVARGGGTLVPTHKLAGYCFRTGCDCAKYERSLRAEIADVLSTRAPDLLMTKAEAEALKDRIVRENATFPAALRVYDLLHHRVVYGRAF